MGNFIYLGGGNEVAAMGTVNSPGKIFTSLKAGTDYQLKIKYRVENLDGDFQPSEWSDTFHASTKLGKNE